MPFAPSHSSKISKPALFITWCLILVLGLATVGFWGLSFTPFAPVRASLDAWSLDGSADYLTRARFAALGYRLRLAGGFALVLTALLWWRRQSIAKLVEILLGSLAKVYQDFAAHMEAIGRRETSWRLFALGLVLAAGAGLRLYYLGQPIRYDEATTFMEYANKPLPVALSYYSSPNNHLFHTLLLNLCTSLLGNDLWVIRLPALMAGFLIIPFAYLLVRKFYGGDAGLLAAALCAMNPVLVGFSVNARGYTLLTLFFLLLWLLSVYLRTHREPGGWTLWALIAALGLWTIPNMVVGIAVVLAWFLLSPGPREWGFWQRWQPLALICAGAGGIVLTLLLYAPVLMGSGPQALAFGGMVADQGWRMDRVLAVLEGMRWITFQDMASWVVALLLGGAALSLAWHLGRKAWPKRGAWPLLALALGALIILYLMGGKPPPARSWLLLIPIILGLGGAGIAWVLARAPRTKHMAPALALLVLLALGGHLVATGAVEKSEETGTLRDGPAITQFFKKHLKPGDGLLSAVPADEPLAYYFFKEGMDPSAPFMVLTGRLKGKKRIWLVAKHSGYSNLDWLLEHARIKRKEWPEPQEVRQFSESTIYILER